MKNTQDLINVIHEDNKDITKKTISTVIDCAFDVIKDSIVLGDDVFISGFGKFKSKKQKGRSGVVQFGESKGSAYHTEDKNIPCFTAAKKFKEEMNVE